jgi:hypothetical protein
MKSSKETTFLINIKWLKTIFVKIYILSRYTTKYKYTLKMIKIIAKLNEVFIHILNMSWLYHFNYNWKVWLMWFHKKYIEKFFIQTNKVCWEKTFCWKIIFIWKITKIMLEAFLLKFILYVYQNVRWNQITTAPKIYPKIVLFFWPKTVPPS